MEETLELQGAFGYKHPVPKKYEEHLTLVLAKESDRMIHIGHGDYVLPFSGILRCLARQVEISCIKGIPIECLAGACRIAFECRMNTRLMIKHPRLIREWDAGRFFEELLLLEGLKKLKESPLFPPKPLSPEIKANIAALKERIKRDGLARPSEPVSAAKKCQELGMSREYRGLYYVFSKYCHATPTLCANEPRQSWEGVFIDRTRQYATETSADIQLYVSRLRPKNPVKPRPLD